MFIAGSSGFEEAQEYKRDKPKKIKK